MINEEKKNSARMAAGVTAVILAVIMLFSVIVVAAANSHIRGNVLVDIGVKIVSKGEYFRISNGFISIGMMMFFIYAISAAVFIIRFNMIKKRLLQNRLKSSSDEKSEEGKEETV